MIWLLVGYMILFIHRPFEIWPELATVRLERVYMIAVLVCALFTGKIRFVAHPINTWLFAFLCAVLLSWFFSPWFATESAQKVVTDWLKVVLFFLLIPAFVTNRKELDILIVGFVVATGIYVTHSVAEYFLGRHQFSMGVKRLLGINETLKHANAFAAVSVLAMPIAYFVFTNAEEKWIRYGAAAYGLLATLGTILTSSRMGTIGLGTVALMLILQSKRRLILLVVIPVVAMSIWTALPDNKKERIISIFDSSVGPKNARESGETRAASFYLGLELFARYPVFGTGPGAWRDASGSEIVSHNLYGQVPGETGFIGSASFFLFVSTCIYCAAKLYFSSRNNGLLDEEQSKYFSSLAAAFLWVLVLKLIFGFAGGSLFRFYWIWNAGFILVATQVFAMELEEGWDEENEEFDDDDDPALTNIELELEE